MSKKFTRLFLLLPLLAVLALQATAQNTALTLTAATSPIVSFGMDVIPVDQPITVELWAYIPSATNNDALEHDLIIEGSAGAAFSIGYTGGTAGSPHKIVLGDVIGVTSIDMPFDQWVHIAVAGDLTPTIQNVSLYVNGAPALVMGNNSFTFIPVNGQPTFEFGRAEDSTTYADAQIEQVRVWGVERSAAEVKFDMFGTILNNTPGLLAAYYMNEGSGTNVGNAGSLGSAANGTLQNGITWTPSPIERNPNAVNLNGTTSEVSMAANPAYDLTSGGTIEAWIYPTAIAGANRTIIGNRGSVGANYSFHIGDPLNTGAGTEVGLWNNNAYLPIPATIPLNTWTHLAFVYNGTTSVEVFLNGISIGTIGEAFSGITGQELTIGIGKPSNNDPFQGSIDEVRIWNTQRTGAQIAANKDFTLTGSEAGLVGIWNFDEGLPGGTNTGLLVVPDNSSTTNNGTMVNFALSGASSNFVSHTLTPLPVTLTKFSVVKQGTGALLQWQTATEQNSKDFVIQRSTDGIKYNGIGSVEAAGNSTSLRNYAFVDPSPVTGKNYYRLNQTDLDGKSAFSPVRLLSFTNTGKLVWYSTGSRSVEVSLQMGSNEKYIISDISGHLVRQGQLSSGKTSLSGLPGGIYIVKVTNFAGESMDAKVVLP